jgi:hypothetical protein
MDIFLSEMKTETRAQIEYGEAIALRRAVLLARDRGMDKAIFALDCLC